MRRSVSMKAFVLILAITLVLGCAVGGTLAWLMTQTTPVTNTFTATNIEITLTETSPNSFALIPGKEYKKDPVVTVTDNTTVDCWLFVKIDETQAAKDYLTYTLALEGWALVDGQTNVYARTAKTGDSYHLLTGDKVTVKDSVTLDNMTAAAAAELSFTAYAVQLEGFEGNAAGAWAKLPNN